MGLAGQRSGPDSSTRILAEITDGRLVPDLRTAIVAVGWWFDAWWSEARRSPSTVQRKRAELIEVMREKVAALGAAASLSDLAKATDPLLGSYFDTREINAGVDMIRDVTMHHWPHIRRAREEVARWDDVYGNRSQR